MVTELEGVPFCVAIIVMYTCLIRIQTCSLRNSGGGTLNVVQHLRALDVNFLESKVLIIHSGGDSKRAPLSSLCGKAWTTLNGVVDEINIVSPLALLIQEISSIFQNLPNESIVVASSDVMLDVWKVQHSAQN